MFRHQRRRVEGRDQPRHQRKVHARFDSTNPLLERILVSLSVTPSLRFTKGQADLAPRMSACGHELTQGEGQVVAELTPSKVGLRRLSGCLYVTHELQFYQNRTMAVVFRS